MIKSFKDFINNDIIKESIDISFENEVEDFIGDELTFYMSDIQKYVKGDVTSIVTTTNKAGVCVFMNYESGDGIKNGSGELYILPDKGNVFYHGDGDGKRHPIEVTDEKTIEVIEEITNIFKN